MNSTSRVALVTGASRGIGKAIAFALAKDGCDLVLTSRNESALCELSHSVKGLGVNCHYFPFDLADDNSAENLITNIREHIGRLDILVNNAGGVENAVTLKQLTMQDWRNIFEVNFFSVVRLVNAAVPLLSQSSNARILNIGSLVATQPGYYNPHYSAAKAALLNFSKVLSNQLADSGVLVNTVCPGSIRTESWEENILRIASEQNHQKPNGFSLVENEEISKVPLRRLGLPEEVAAAVVFLASPQASLITGTCLYIDGGKHKSIM